MTVKFNHSKLLGKMKELEITQENLAKEISVTESTLNLKLNGKSCFTTREISKICKALNILPKQIGEYFFAD